MGLYNCTDLNEVKSALGISLEDTRDDKRVSLFINWASSWIEGYLNRPLFLKERTQICGGSGTQKLLLKARPVYATPTVRAFVDEGALFGTAPEAFPASSELEYGTDFTLWADRDDGGSDCGILVRSHDYWPKRSVRQRGLLTPFIAEAFGNVKVIYTAGYDPSTLPDEIAMACIELIGRMRGYFPNGAPISSESYEERSVSFSISDRNWLMGQVKHRLSRFRNWRF